MAISSRYRISKMRSFQEDGSVAVRFSMKFQLVSLFIYSSDNVTRFLMVCKPKTLSFLNVAIEEFLFKIASFLREEMPDSSNLRQSSIVCTVLSWSFPLFKKGISMRKSHLWLLPWCFNNYNFHVVKHLEITKSVVVLHRTIAVVRFI